MSPLPQWVWIDGDFHAGDQRAVSPFDRGLMYGDGLYETLLGTEGHPRHFALHWARPGMALIGNPAMQVDVDSFGAFEVTLTVPISWPGGIPADHDSIELHAIGIEDREAWAAYAYMPPPIEYVAPGGTYTNETYGYAVDLPSGWTAQEADPVNVIFGPPGGVFNSFIRVSFNSDPNAVIDALMAEFAPGLLLGIEEGQLGVESGTRVTVTDDRQIYWFVPHNGRTYVLHFDAPEGSSSDLIYSTFRFIN